MSPSSTDCDPDEPVQSIETQEDTVILLPGHSRFPDICMPSPALADTDRRSRYNNNFTLKDSRQGYKMAIEAGDDKPFGDLAQGWANAITQAGQDTNPSDYLYTIKNEGHHWKDIYPEDMATSLNDLSERG